jgi:hypothetical protein
MSTGEGRASTSTCNRSASNVLCRRCCGGFEHGIASIARQRQHLGNERGVLRECFSLIEQSVELVEFRLRGVVARQSGSTFHLADDRIKRTISVLRGAKIAHRRVFIAIADSTLQRRRQLLTMRAERPLRRRSTACCDPQPPATLFACRSLVSSASEALETSFSTA